MPAVPCPLNSCQLAAVLLPWRSLRMSVGAGSLQLYRPEPLVGGPWVTRQSGNCQGVRDPKALEPRLTLDLYWGLPGLRARNVGQVAKSGSGGQAGEQ